MKQALDRPHLIVSITAKRSPDY